MKKVYVIQRTEYYWNKKSSYTTSSFKIEFAFSSKKRAVEQLEKIAEANAKGEFWLGEEFDYEEDIETFNALRTDAYSKDFVAPDGTEYRYTFYYSIVERELNNGFNL